MNFVEGASEERALHKDSELAEGMTDETENPALPVRIRSLRARMSWRHPTPLSALAWLFCGAGSLMTWRDGRLVDGPVYPFDQPYLAPDAIEAMGAGRAPPPLSTRLTEFLPAAGAIVPSLHTRDFAPSGSLPAARIPFEADSQHLAGSIIACRVMLACAPLLLEPAGMPRGRLRTLLRSALNAACLIAAERQCEDEVIGQAESLLNDKADATVASVEFADPLLSGDDR